MYNTVLLFIIVFSIIIIEEFSIWYPKPGSQTSDHAAPHDCLPPTRHTGREGDDDGLVRGGLAD